MAVTDAPERIAVTQALIASVENGRSTWDFLLETVVLTLLDLKAARTGEEAIELFADLYTRLRPIEAAAYRFRGSTEEMVSAEMKLTTTNLVNWAREQRAAIEETLAASQGWEEQSSNVGTYGLFSIKKDLRWALGTIDRFDDWGY